tara:strand:- start:593 stop:931 length:339 start_codon:yes stop_codon:yes gene_type:complete
MASYYAKIKLYLEANSKTWEAEENNILIQDDGGGEYIKTWNVEGLAKPSNTKLNSYNTAANTLEANAAIDANRRSQYGTWQQQMEMVYKDQKNGTTTFKDHCDKVRSDNPKE